MTHPKHIDSLHRSQEYLPDNAVVKGKTSTCKVHNITTGECKNICTFVLVMGAGSQGAAGAGDSDQDTVFSSDFEWICVPRLFVF